MGTAHGAPGQPPRPGVRVHPGAFSGPGGRRLVGAAPAGLAGLAAARQAHRGTGGNQAGGTGRLVAGPGPRGPGVAGRIAIVGGRQVPPAVAEEVAEVVAVLVA